MSAATDTVMQISAKLRWKTNRRQPDVIRSTPPNRDSINQIAQSPADQGRKSPDAQARGKRPFHAPGQRTEGASPAPRAKNDNPRLEGKRLNATPVLVTRSNSKKGRTA